MIFLEFGRCSAKPPRGLLFLRRKLMKSQIRRLAMRAPPMRQPTAAPAISPVLNCGPGVDAALDAELENVDVGEAGCGGACEVPGELGDSSDVKLMEVVVWEGTWIAGIVVSDPTWKAVVL